MHDYLPTCTPLVSALDKPVLQAWHHDFRFGGISILWTPFIELGIEFIDVTSSFRRYLSTYRYPMKHRSLFVEDVSVFICLVSQFGFNIYIC